MDAAVTRDTAHQANAFAQIWERIYQRRDAAFPPDAIRHARRAVVDTLACVIGGAAEPATRAARQVGSGNGAMDLALKIGTASHALDYDDVCMLATCHPSAPVLSAVISLLAHDATNASLQDVLQAHLAGTEIMLRLGAWLGFDHYALGFHATGTLGVIGAAAACARLLQLPLDQARHAVALAASSASGLRGNFGTDTKPLHVGFAASAAVRAVLLARAGASANVQAALAGFARAYAGDRPLALPDWHDEQPWAMCAPGFEVKRFPSCYLTHRMIAGVLQLRKSHPYALQQDEVRIDIEFPPDGSIALLYPDPHTGLQGKFSAPYCAASAWIDGRVNLATFTDQAVQRADVRALMPRVHVVERQGLAEPLDTAPVRVSISHAGSVLVDWAPGSLQDPPTDAELAAKWRDGEAFSAIALQGCSPDLLLTADVHTRAADLLAPILLHFQ